MWQLACCRLQKTVTAVLFQAWPVLPYLPGLRLSDTGSICACSTSLKEACRINLTSRIVPLPQVPKCMSLL